MPLIDKTLHQKDEGSVIMASKILNAWFLSVILSPSQSSHIKGQSLMQNLSRQAIANTCLLSMLYVKFLWAMVNFATFASFKAGVNKISEKSR